MPQEMIALLMFSTMLVLMITGQRVFGVIGVVAVVAALALWGTGGQAMGFSASMKLMKWYPMLTLPMFVFMGYVMSETRLAEDLYKMFHVWFGPVPGGLAPGSGMGACLAGPGTYLARTRRRPRTLLRVRGRGARSRATAYSRSSSQAFTARRERYCSVCQSAL